ncbi:flagellar biosynthetic protein FliO [Candidatus Weimeria sp. HCP3S3_B5]|uniref:flagellar biosynthetic protein FliO n=1 Tax=Candidatus Weimeria sp. HCP3S3_B5 TaxID=3438871 RepID=UPI002A953047|nr:flagellar biosynthetic protein FliO [Lachnospiraceae bacterium]MDY6352598.1 flagellar biosynthetic protein FliO [Lachnospiraceae bacterium]
MILLQASSISSLGQLVAAIVMFVVVVALCYFTTHFIGQYQKKKLSTGNFAIVDSFRIANNKFIAIVKAGTDSYYIIGVGKDEITLIDKIDKDQISFKSYPAGKEQVDFGRFREMFKKYAGRGGKDDSES